MQRWLAPTPLCARSRCYRPNRYSSVVDHMGGCRYVRTGFALPLSAPPLIALARSCVLSVVFFSMGVVFPLTHLPADQRDLSAFV